jgi:nickel-dependent lactate racemase
MPTINVPYGKGEVNFRLPDGVQAELIAPRQTLAEPDPEGAVEAALSAPLGGVHWHDFLGARSAAIAINDKTRPVPHHYLLPPLLRRLRKLGLSPEAITIIIATGAHPSMLPEEYGRVVPADVLARYSVLCHAAGDRENLLHRGRTARGTPVWVNRHFAAADLRIVVGNIEPHQFQGFSGGMKGAAIGLAGRETITHNHALMSEPLARLGCYDDNPARQDVEEIGRLMGVHLALNAVLNGQKEIVQVVGGEPLAVMRAGIPVSREVCEVAVAAPFDLVIASPGGHPKDINLYQSQKALAHAGLVARDGGTVIVAAACPEGSGSQSYETWMAARQSHEEVMTRFRREGFRLGPHKAYLVSRDAARLRVFLVSDMSPERVRRFLLEPAESIDAALAASLPAMPPDARIGVVPQASSTIPQVLGYT